MSVKISIANTGILRRYFLQTAGFRSNRSRELRNARNKLIQSGARRPQAQARDAVAGCWRAAGSLQVFQLNEPFLLSARDRIVWTLPGLAARAALDQDLSDDIPGEAPVKFKVTTITEED